MIKFTMSANATPAQLRDALSAEISRRLSVTESESYRDKTKLAKAHREGQQVALRSALNLLLNLEFTTEPLKECAECP